ncbi:MAG: response regulator [Chthoniobacterales bacterium]
MPDSLQTVPSTSSQSILPAPDSSVPRTRILPGTNRELIPRRLLVVEDHESTATVMQRLLQRHGHEVWVALNYHQALEMVREHAIEAVICDLELPDGDGCDLLQELQKHAPIRGIVVSGHGSEEDVRRSRDAGFAAHLVKPFDINQIEHTLTDVFRTTDA